MVRGEPRRAGARNLIRWLPLSGRCRAALIELGHLLHVLVDQGLADAFLPNQLNPDVFEAACKAAGQPLTLRRHEGYDHGYFFIQSFIEDHLAHHARVLLK